MAFYLERSENDPETAFLGVDEGPVKGFVTLRWAGEDKRRATLRVLALAAAAYGKHRKASRGHHKHQSKRSGRFGR